ncbi:MAG: class F sortase [Sporichthyaceae bacterium]
MITGVLAVSGVAVLGVAATRPDAPPQPPVAAASESGTPTTQPPTTPSPTASTQPVAPLVLPASRPISIAIPAIRVTAPLLRLGRAADNTIEVPPPGRHYDDAGWYRYSPTPGELGPSVIVGHVDSAKNGPSVFWRLGTLRKNDRVRVTRTDGSVAIFEVDTVLLFRKKAFPTKLVYGNTDHAALRLITCGGPFDSAGHYRDNVVVLASLVASAPSGRNAPG